MQTSAIVRKYSIMILGRICPTDRRWNDMIGISGIAIWLISFIGLVSLTKRVFRADDFTAPAVSAACAMVFLVLSGMAGVLKAAAYLLYAVGFSGLVAKAVCRKKPGKDYVCVVSACVLWLAFLTFRLRNAWLYHPDDFGHWGLVARFLLSNNAFPDAAMELMHFPSYPPATAVFIYYFGLFSENSDRIYMIAQAFLVFLFALPMLSLFRKALFRGAVCTFCVFVILSGVCTFIDTLQVDTLIAFMGFAILAISVPKTKTPGRMVVSALPVMAAMGLVKISGLFYAVLCAPVFAYAARKRKTKKAVFSCLFAPAIALAAYFLWQAYANARFPMADESVHVMNLSSYMKRAAERIYMIKPVIKAYIGNVVHASFVEWGLLLFSFLTPAALMIYAHMRKMHKIKKQEIGLICFLTATYLLYNLMMISMYLFSMSEAEAQTIASFTRYYRAILVYMSLISAAEGLGRIYGEKGLFRFEGAVKYAAVSALVMAVFAGIATGSYVSDFVKPARAYPYYEKCRILNGELERRMEKYIVFSSPDDDFPDIYEMQLNMMLLYELNTLDVVSIVRDEAEGVYRIYDRRYETEKSGGVFYLLNEIPFETVTAEEMKKAIAKYDGAENAILILDEDEEIEEMLGDSKA